MLNTKLARVGILGGFGFVGTNLCEHLTNNGISAYQASRRNGVDATDPDSILRWLRHSNITHLVNLAAECGGIGLNAKRPADLWRSVTAISHAVLEAATKHNHLLRLIMVGSVCSYSRDCPVPFKEDDLMHHGCPEPTNLAYGVAKLAGLFGAQAYAKQYRLPIFNLIPVNMYGPCDNFDLENSHVIPAIIRKIDDAIAAGRDVVELWGSGRATREFLHVSDCCHAIRLALAADLVTPEFINIGTGNEIAIADLTTKIAEIMGYRGSIRWDAAKPDGQPRRCLDISRARTVLGYSPLMRLHDGLCDTIAWYRQTS